MIAATQARDEALDRVTREPFNTAAARAIAEIPHGERVTGEDIRLDLTSKGIVPHHHNAWGAAIRAAVIRGVLIYTGEYVQMSEPKSHARRTPLYVRANRCA